MTYNVFSGTLNPAQSIPPCSLATPLQTHAHMHTWVVRLVWSVRFRRHCVAPPVVPARARIRLGRSSARPQPRSSTVSAHTRHYNRPSNSSVTAKQ